MQAQQRADAATAAMESMLAAAAGAAEREAVPVISTRSTVTSVRTIMRHSQVSALQAPEHLSVACFCSRAAPSSHCISVQAATCCMPVPGFCVCLLCLVATHERLHGTAVSSGYKVNTRHWRYNSRRLAAAGPCTRGEGCRIAPHHLLGRRRDDSRPFRFYFVFKPGVCALTPDTSSMTTTSSRLRAALARRATLAETI